MNIFEGARRVALVVAGIGVMGGVASALSDTPYASVSYEVATFGAQPVAIDSCPFSAHNALFSERREASNGKEYTFEICFKAEPADDGRQLIAYEKVGDRINMNDDGSLEVLQYIAKVAARLPQTTEEAEKMGNQLRIEKVKQVFMGLLGVAAGLAFFWVFVAVVGWIVRGFMGIPSGLDKRPVVQ